MVGAEWLDMEGSDVCIYHGAGEPQRIEWLPNVRWLI